MEAKTKHSVATSPQRSVVCNECCHLYCQLLCFTWTHEVQYFVNMHPHMQVKLIGFIYEFENSAISYVSTFTIVLTLQTCILFRNFFLVLVSAF